MKLKWMAPDAKVIVSWPVTFEAPADGGGFERETVSLTFEMLTSAEVQAALAPTRDAILTAITDGDVADPLLAFQRRVVVGWDEDGLGEPFSAEALERLLRFTWARNAVHTAYSAAQQGRRSKN